MDSNELRHHGILGMKWGVRRTDAQLGRGSSKSAKKTLSNKSKVADKKKTSTTKTDSKEEIAAKKEVILKSRSAKKIYENADLFTDAELQTAYNRLQLERNIAGLAPKEVKKGEQFVDNAIKWGRKVNDVSDTGLKLYNNIAKMRNTFSDSGRSNPWPIVGAENKKKASVGKKISSMVNQQKKQSSEKTGNEKQSERKSESPTSTSDKKEERHAKEEKRKVYTGTVEPKRTHKRTVNADWRNMRTTNLLEDRYVSSGRNYISGLLEDKQR